MTAPSDPEPEEKISLPSETFRTVVSLLIFVHLFAVGVAMLTGNPNGNSTLLSNVKMRTPGLEPYVWQLWLDHGYDYNFMGFMPMFEDTASMDWPYHLEATLNYGPGRSPEVVELPEPGIAVADRRERWQQLPRALAAFSQWPEGPQIDDTVRDRRHQIGGSIGAGLLHEHPDAKFVTLRWYYHRGKTAPEIRLPELPPWTPTDPRYFVTVGTMRVELSDEGRPESWDILPQAEISPLKPQKSGAASATSPSAGSIAAPNAESK